MAYNTSPAVNATPAPGVFHSATSQAAAVAASSTGKAEPVRHIAIAAPTAIAPAASSAASAVPDAPVNARSGSRRTITSVAAAKAVNVIAAAAR